MQRYQLQEIKNRFNAMATLKKPFADSVHDTIIEGNIMRTADFLDIRKLSKSAYDA